MISIFHNEAKDFVVVKGNVYNKVELALIETFRLYGSSEVELKMLDEHAEAFWRESVRNGTATVHQ